MNRGDDRWPFFHRNTSQIDLNRAPSFEGQLNMRYASARRNWLAVFKFGGPPEQLVAIGLSLHASSPIDFNQVTADSRSNSK